MRSAGVFKGLIGVLSADSCRMTYRSILQPTGGGELWFTHCYALVPFIATFTEAIAV